MRLEYMPNLELLGFYCDTPPLSYVPQTPSLQNIYQSRPISGLQRDFLLSVPDVGKHLQFRCGRALNEWASIRHIVLADDCLETLIDITGSARVPGHCQCKLSCGFGSD